jgi:hypothetical protein
VLVLGTVLYEIYAIMIQITIESSDLISIVSFVLVAIFMLLVLAAAPAPFTAFGNVRKTSHRS